MRRIKGGKKSRQKVNATYTVSFRWLFAIKAIVFWIFKKPHCFVSVKDRNRPSGVHYFSNQKVQMSSNSSSMLRLHYETTKLQG